MNKLKNLPIVLLLAVLFSKTTSHAQFVKVDSLFWVLAKDVSAFKASQSFTSNPLLNDLFDRYKVHKYEQALPWSKSDQLLRLYEVGCDCNIDSLIFELNAFYPNIYSGIKRLDYQNIALYDPTDYMWWLTTQDTTGWLWHLKKIKANLAWDITLGDPNVKTAIIDTDFDIDHPDLTGKISPTFDPFDSIPYDCQTFHSHGTSVASYVAGETTELGDTAVGQLASVGFNTMMIGYKAWSGNYLQRAHHASLVMGAHVLTSSAGGWSSCPAQDGGIDSLMVKEILNNGTTIIMPAGNGNGTHNECPSIDPVNHTAFFPLHPYYDERIIIVTSTGKDDKHVFTNNPSGTHSHFPDVDICSPGYETMSAMPSNCGANSWPYYGFSNGTSFATPIVAGVAALMYSVNPCLTPEWCQNILKNTTDPIVDAANFPGTVGTGRVNAYKAVKAAQESNSSILDLFIKDRNEDFGNQQYPYHWQADRDKSPDVWVRNQQDGFTNQTHQQPEYSATNPVYVYVRVHNKSCQPATGNEILRLYWSKASSWSSWPQNWDGSQPNIGNQIGEFNLGTLAPGRDTILQFTWTILNPYMNNNWGTCLLARIENSAFDVITIHPNRLDDDVYFNNNIAMRNVNITDNIPGIVVNPGKWTENVLGVASTLPGKFMFIGNPTDVSQTYDIELNGQDSPNLTQDGDLKILFDTEGWSLLENVIRQTAGIEVLDEGIVKLTQNNVRLSNVTFPPQTRVPVYVGINFIIDQIINKTEDYEYHVRQYFAVSDSLLGGVHYQFTTPLRENGFDANAGEDVKINKGDSILLQGTPISELAEYNWYESSGQFIGSSLTILVKPENTSAYTFEVISQQDGVKDADDVLVEVNENFIRSISPNPALNEVTVEYSLANVSSAKIVLVNTITASEFIYPINLNTNETILFLSNVPTGHYLLKLIADEVVADSKAFVKL